MADKLMILMVNADPTEYGAEVIRTARSGERGKNGVAEKRYVRVCAPTLALGGEDLIPEIGESGGCAY